MITQIQFIENFPAFATQPPGQITFWLGQGYSQLNEWRFGEQLDYAIQLFAAHNLVLAMRDARNSAIGGAIGAAAGMINSKTVGGVTAAYDTASTAIEGAGIYNATSYGQTLYKLMQGVSLGVGYVPGRARPFGLPGFRAGRNLLGW